MNNNAPVLATEVQTTWMYLPDTIKSASEVTGRYFSSSPLLGLVGAVVLVQVASLTVVYSSSTETDLLCRI
jgi:hypothetical protein